MRFYLLSILFTLSMSGHSQTNGYDSKDLEALNSFAVKWAKYWNMHNVDSMGTLCTDNLDFINVAGVWTKNKEELMKQSKERHEGMFKNGVWKTDSISIKYIKPDLAIMHLGWGIEGDLDPDGSPRKPRHGIFTWVVIKQKNQWLLLAAHNVNIRSTLSN